MKIIKIIGYIFLLLVVSWVMAQWWSDHGSWWFSIFPRWALKLMNYVAGPVLSREAWEAEGQLEFLVFWVPSFILLASMALPIFLIKNKSQKLNRHNQKKSPDQKAVR